MVQGGGLKVARPGPVKKPSPWDAACTFVESPKAFTMPSAAIPTGSAGQANSIFIDIRKINKAMAPAARPLTGGLQKFCGHLVTSYYVTI
jgi:hypothetical protein